MRLQIIKKEILVLKNNFALLLQPIENLNILCICHINAAHAEALTNFRALSSPIHQN